MGRVEVSDALKLYRQVTYGRPKPAARAALARGVTMAEQFKANGRKLLVAGAAVAAVAAAVKPDAALPSPDQKS